MKLRGTRETKERTEVSFVVENEDFVREALRVLGFPETPQTRLDTYEPVDLSEAREVKIEIRWTDERSTEVDVEHETPDVATRPRRRS